MNAGFARVRARLLQIATELHACAEGRNRNSQPQQIPNCKAHETPFRYGTPLGRRLFGTLEIQEAVADGHQFPALCRVELPGQRFIHRHPLPLLAGLGRLNIRSRKLPNATNGERGQSEQTGVLEDLRREAPGVGGMSKECSFYPARRTPKRSRQRVVVHVARENTLRTACAPSDCGPYLGPSSLNRSSMIGVSGGRAMRLRSTIWPSTISSM